MSFYDIVRKSLDEEQLVIHQECKRKKSGGLFIPMGGGKTRLSIANALSNGGISCVVASKTALTSWCNELDSIFGGKFPYEVVSPAGMTKKTLTAWKRKPETQMVLISPEYMVSIYSRHDPHFRRCVQEGLVDGWRRVFEYHTAREPETSIGEEGPLSIFSTLWDTLIIDEVQHYTNIGTKVCKTLLSLAAKRRWCLSGTPIRSSKIEFILGYYCLIDYTCPRTVEEMKTWLSRRGYKGVNKSAVVRTKEESTLNIRIKRHIVRHPIHAEERRVFVVFKDMLKKLINDLLENVQDVQHKRQLRAAIMANFTYLRQALLCPVLPIGSIMLRMYEVDADRSICRNLSNELLKSDLGEWLNDPSSVISSRLEEVMKVLSNHTKERCIVFTSFRTSVDVFMHYCGVNLNRPLFTLESKYSIDKRREVINAFENTPDGVLFLTYKLGCEALNLQKQHVCLLSDLEWTLDDMDQAIARMARRGQEEEVQVYIFTSDTGLEKAILTRQKEKSQRIAELMKGRMKTTIHSITFVKLLKGILQEEDTVSIIEDIY